MGWTQRTLDRTRLGRAAARYAAQGWDVVPGAAFAGTRFRCDDPGCLTVGCHPASSYWRELATRDLDVVETWWRHTPYAVLLPTGRAFDVLDVPATLCTPVLADRGVRGLAGPVAVAPSGRWMFLVRPGDGLRPELAERDHVVLHGQSSWIPAPPTRDPSGRARWAVSPEDVGWRLPRSYVVQESLVRALEVAATRVVTSRTVPAWPMNAPVDPSPA